eukprot:GILI01030313.1.p1 GENE.GILI01030313.1~~GILI01030313.1.p1  ORF type:complete len:171 (+),score=18.03 GILI01030313.1:503-1015(+)
MDSVALATDAPSSPISWSPVCLLALLFIFTVLRISSAVWTPSAPLPCMNLVLLPLIPSPPPPSSIASPTSLTTHSSSCPCCCCRALYFFLAPAAYTLIIFSPSPPYVASSASPTATLLLPLPLKLLPQLPLSPILSPHPVLSLPVYVLTRPTAPPIPALVSIRNPLHLQS